jgi:hypothetical protein
MLLFSLDEIQGRTSRPTANLLDGIRATGFIPIGCAVRGMPLILGAHSAPYGGIA